MESENKGLEKAIQKTQEEMLSSRPKIVILGNNPDLVEQVNNRINEYWQKRKEAIYQQREESFSLYKFYHNIKTYLSKFFS